MSARLLIWRVVLVAVKTLATQDKGQRGSGWSDGCALGRQVPNGSAPQRDAAYGKSMALVKQRYARGRIDHAECERDIEILLTVTAVAAPRLSPRHSAGRLTFFRSRPMVAGNAARAPISCTWSRSKQRVVVACPKNRLLADCCEVGLAGCPHNQATWTPLSRPACQSPLATTSQGMRES
jgi:hypothetical protein